MPQTATLFDDKLATAKANALAAIDARKWDAFAASLAAIHDTCGDSFGRLIERFGVDECSRYGVILGRYGRDDIMNLFFQRAIKMTIG